MKAIKTLLILCIAFSFASCKKDVDMTLVQKTVLENADIRQIKAFDAWEVTIVADSNTYVELEYSAYLENKVNVKMQGTQLEIGFTGSTYPVFNSVFRAVVHTNTIESIEAEDAAELYFVGHFSATSDTLYVDLEDASVCSGLDYSGHIIAISIADDSDFLDFHLSGYNCETKVLDASTCKGVYDMSFHLVATLSDASQFITFGGSAPYGMITLRGASVLNAVQTEFREMHVDLSDASEATVDVSERIEGSVKAASTLYYKGHPQMEVECSEDSHVISL
ncbi:MAG: DUF2807 domain-containing protein [Bacteroidales bacterium]|nr:DUF2807 domain-containing protein [Bacteroidales bacterium]